MQSTASGGALEVGAQYSYRCSVGACRACLFVPLFGVVLAGYLPCTLWQQRSQLMEPYSGGWLMVIFALCTVFLGAYMAATSLWAATERITVDQNSLESVSILGRRSFALTSLTSAMLLHYGNKGGGGGPYCLLQLETGNKKRTLGRGLGQAQIEDIVYRIHTFKAKRQQGNSPHD